MKSDIALPMNDGNDDIKIGNKIDKHNTDFTQIVHSDSNRNKTYIVSRRDGVLSCTCLAWRKQYIEISKRTCKHLIRVMGAKEEEERAPLSFRGLTRKKPQNHNKHKSLSVKPMLFQSVSLQSLSQIDDVSSETTPKWLIGGYVSEKLDGAFARWQDNHLYTKSGRCLKIPRHIQDKLPPGKILDGEIYSREKRVTLINNIIHGSKDWQDARFIVFDIVPKLGFDECPFEKRLQALALLKSQFHFDMVDYTRIESIQQVQDMLATVTDRKGEGLVLRSAKNIYQPGKRVSTVMKLKPELMSHAIVLAITEKKKGQTLTVKELLPGALVTEVNGNVIERQYSTVFNIYLPNSKTNKMHPIKIGSEIQFSYTGRNHKDHPEQAKVIAR